MVYCVTTGLRIEAGRVNFGSSGWQERAFRVKLILFVFAGLLRIFAMAPNAVEIIQNLVRLFCFSKQIVALCGLFSQLLYSS